MFYRTIIIAALLLTILSTARADEPALVYVEIESETAVVGDHIPTTVKIKNGDENYGAELHFRFDPSQFKVIDADPDTPAIQAEQGDFFDVNQGFLVTNTADNETGELVYAFTLLSPAAPVSGDGVLLTFDLEAIAEGDSDLELTAVILASSEGESLPLTTQSTQVYVMENQPLATPTMLLTMLPTMTPTAVQPASSNTPAPSPTVGATVASTESAVPEITASETAVKPASSPIPSSTPIAAETATPLPVTSEENNDTSVQETVSVAEDGLTAVSTVAPTAVSTDAPPAEIASASEPTAETEQIETAHTTSIPPSSDNNEAETTDATVVGEDNVAPTENNIPSSPENNTPSGLITGVMLVILISIVTAYLFIKRRAKL